MADAVARRSYGKLVAYLSVQTRDVAAAEDGLSDAFAAALKDWPERGVRSISRSSAHRRAPQDDRRRPTPPKP